MMQSEMIEKEESRLKYGMDSHMITCPVGPIVSTINKAGYTATSCGQVGRSGNARFHTFQLVLTNGPTDGPTDRRTDGRTDGQSLL